MSKNKYRVLDESEVPAFVGEPKVAKSMHVDPYTDEITMRVVARFVGVRSKLVALTFIDPEMAKNTAMLDYVATRNMRGEFIYHPPNRRNWPARPYGIRGE